MNRDEKWYKDKTQVCNIIRQGMCDSISYDIAITVYTNGKRFYAVGKTEYSNGEASFTATLNGHPAKNTFKLLLKELRKDARHSMTDELAWNFDKEDAKAVFRIWNGIIADFT